MAVALAITVVCVAATLPAARSFTRGAHRRCRVRPCAFLSCTILQVVCSNVGTASPTVRFLIDLSTDSLDDSSRELYFIKLRPVTISDANLTSVGHVIVR